MVKQNLTIAIVGSRTIRTTREIIYNTNFREEKIRNFLKEMLTDNLEISTIITGGAIGVDTIAEEIGKAFNKQVIVVRPENPTIKRDYILRNYRIVDMSDEVYAFWDGTSKGTQSVIKYTEKIKKPLTIIRI